MIFKKHESAGWRGAAMKNLCCLAVLIGSICLYGVEFSFAENGKAQCLIALPDNPVGFDRDAADDLRTYLG